MTRDTHFIGLVSQDEEGLMGLSLVTDPNVWAVVYAASGVAVIRFTREAVKLAEEVAESIRTIPQGKLIPLKLVCPDGKTQIETRVREKEQSKRIREFLKLCGHR